MRRYPHEVNPDQAHPDPGIGRLRPRSAGYRTEPQRIAVKDAGGFKPGNRIDIGGETLWVTSRPKTRMEKLDDVVALILAIVILSFIGAHFLVAAGVGLVCGQ